MITFVLCNIFERIWYSEFILHTHSRGGTRLMQDWVNWVHKLRIRKKNFIHKKLIIIIRCIIIYYFRLSNVAYPSSTILPSRMRLQCKSARILQGKNYFNNSLFIKYYFLSNDDTLLLFFSDSTQSPRNFNSAEIAWLKCRSWLRMSVAFSTIR